MVVITRRWYSYFMVVVLVILTLVETQGTTCQKPVLSENTTLAPLHSSVNLTCKGCDGGGYWRRHNRQIPSRSGRLALNAVTYTDEDNYTCYMDGAPVCTVQLLVKDELEKPQISCYIRHPTHNITCEWKPTRELRPLAEVTVTAWSITGKHTVTSCSYINSTQTVTCSSPRTEGDTGRYTLSLCVTGRTDSQFSNTLEKSMSDLLLPDPPTDVEVTPVERKPRKLNISWTPPELWLKGLYKLQYEVQYRVETSQHVSNDTTTRTYCTINDALMGRRHIIRVRAMEEFGGPWSSWSKEAVGTPWSDVKDGITTTTLGPSEWYTYEEATTENESKSSIPYKLPTVPRYPWLVAAFSVTLLILLFMIILIRQHEIKLLSLKERLLRTLFQSMPTATRTQPPMESQDVMSPCIPPTSETVSVPMLPAAD
ncbi:interleukin-6 receptor subunit alpha isoform X2 [Mixophyes fleayi]|uniref:interleukin-6 receptor subunit alpha isoform X2 n=1 Tax=Mixophyes fleayi TaxID=3061075 RepID=UPI003F4E24E7